VRRAGGALEPPARGALEQERQRLGVDALAVVIGHQRGERGIGGSDGAADAPGHRGEHGGEFGWNDHHALAVLLGGITCNNSTVPTAGSRWW
jgi:hypothetical protein